jgi:flagellar capping protein FliD
MRTPINALAFTLLALTTLAGCNSTPPVVNNSNSSSTQSSSSQNRAQTVEVPPVAAAHGGATNAPQQTSGAVPADKPSLATPELDAKIAKAEARAKAAKASETDKKAAAAAYVERANVFYNAQQPMLYKFALGDFRRALRYDPANAEAKSKMDEIVSIYQSMGRPVPNNGIDQQ